MLRTRGLARRRRVIGAAGLSVVLAGGFALSAAPAAGLALAACTPARSPLPASSPSPPRVPPPGPLAACAGSAVVPIAAGDVAQRVVDAHPAGTTYLVRAGTHLRNFSVQPK